MASAVALAPASEPLSGQGRNYSRFDRTKVPDSGLYGREVGERLRMRREALGLRQEDVEARAEAAAQRVAEKFGVNWLRADGDLSKQTFARVAYTNYENGKILPGPERIFALAEVLETTAQWLYFGDDPLTEASIMVPESEFTAGRWQDSGRTWALNRDWIAKTFPQVNPSAIAAAQIDNSLSTVVARGDMVLADTDVKPSEVEDEFVYSAAGSIHVGSVTKVSGGYRLKDRGGKESGMVTPHQVRFLGRAIGSIATLDPS